MSYTADKNVFIDLSGAVTADSENPYDALNEACSNDSVTQSIRFYTSLKIYRRKSSSATGPIVKPETSSKEPSCSLRTLADSYLTLYS